MVMILGSFTNLKDGTGEKTSASLFTDELFDCSAKLQLLLRVENIGLLCKGETREYFH
ncbi:hypothetical protein [Commensalibacter oyaizuii]|uniref:Uncharacterized protein n=1 Tax=Commensalibacter oyaizuii TaxID=3043873 RepID=A0ABT6Q2F4_9PROT|nr:hypothetical protein [Commensalibacter sp. TBRC 16381]MDI2091309.1 hypothetical protein [Commensalibacter sp. TBRC 16381]